MEAKKKRPRLRLFLLISLGFSLNFLVNCASAPDVPTCIEISPSKGFCVWTISEKEQFVDEEMKLEGKTWWELRPSLIMVPASSYAEFKKSFIKLCKKTRQCKKNISKWERKLDKLKRDQ